MPLYILVLSVISLLPTLFNLQWPADWDGRLFVLLMAASHHGLMALSCCLPGWACLRWRRLQPLAVPLVVALSGAWLLLVVVDARVYQLFDFHLNGLVWALLLQGGLIQQLGLPKAAWFVVVAVLAGVVLLLWMLVGLLRSVRARRWLLRPRMLLGLLPLLLAGQGMAIWFDANQGGAALAALQAIPWVQTATARRTMVAWGLAAPEPSDDALQAGSDSSTALTYPRRPLQCTEPAPLNVVLLVVDSLRFDMLSPQQMPNLSRLASQAWRAEQHYSTGNNTMHGVFGLFYGLPALHTDTMIHHRRGPVLLEELARNNYQFHLYGGASLQGARLDRAVFVQTDALLETAPAAVPQYLRDRHVVERLRHELRTQDRDRPFFAFALLDGAHTPYAVPEHAERRFLPQARSGDHLKVGRGTDPTPLFNRYRNAVLNVDTLVGDVLQTLQETGLDEHTVVVVTSDHGESFNDLGQDDWGHNSNFSDYQIRVPLVIRWPGRPPAQEGAVTSHMDVAPTLLRHLLGCRNDVSDYSTGLDLFSDLPMRRPLVVESWTSRAVRLGSSTLLLRPYGIEARDAHYQRTDGKPALEPAVRAGIIGQMQLPH